LGRTYVVDTLEEASWQASIVAKEYGCDVPHSYWGENCSYKVIETSEMSGKIWYTNMGTIFVGSLERV
jgi:hypothetical protein